ncbi:hypothetical protein [Paractinoplanes toevensis]|uniref:Neutral/alkaline non-lysosomal ceramidase N-terminal domain-containing protein n=1 Tax=Paractinoplanes toevensis TaxID=571911 RepID=A0A919TAK5_9ACTN|nr:hypothetical protein [Actinoplanes toevensis]GIM90719.1 hypothetical protein Ato02nite_025120 [Actinoplanes toevensis]
MPEITSSLLAGAGRTRIALPAELFPVDGFVAERDPLHARVVLLERDGRRIALAVLDQTSIGADSLAGIISALTRAAEVGPTQVLVCASHTFSAPHVVPDGPPELQRALEDAVEDAARRAARMRPARIGFATGTADVNVNRDVPTPDGWWLGANETGPSDKELGILRIDDEHGNPIAVLMNYAVQASAVHDSGEKVVSADLAGAAAAHVEQAYPGAVALFLVGAAGDQAPTRTGEHLGAAAVDAVECATGTVATPRIRLVHDKVEVGAQPLPRREDIRPQRAYDYRAAGVTAVPLWAVRIGGLAIAAVQAELTCVTGRWIKDNSPFPATFVVTMANGAAKYLADAGSYGRITYAAMNSKYAAGSAELVATRLVETLRGLADHPA